MCANQKTTESYSEAYRSETEGLQRANSICDTDNEERTIYTDLIEDVLAYDNMARALKQVKSNKGAPGVDGMTIDELDTWLENDFQETAEKIRNGKYKPQPVRRKEIPKPNGGVRNLGIPSVVDRLLQQAVAQVLMPIYEPTFSETSYGFRPGRSPHDAIRKAKEYAENGYGTVVDLDLEKFFDTLNQDFLMNILRERIKDKALIELIKRFLRSGVVLPDGLRQETRQGSPQGVPLSPLLSNIYLDKFDKLLESRGLHFCRYADDCLIFVRTPRAGERVRESVTRYLEKDLKLKVNQEKTMVGGATAVKFLGFKLYRRKGIHIILHRTSLKSFKKEVRMKTKRNRNRRLVSILDELKTYVRGWFGYFAIGLSKSRREELNKWMRRRVRQYIFKQWKTPRNRAKQLIRLCPESLKLVPGHIPDYWLNGCYKTAYSRSYWKVSDYFYVRDGLSNRVLKDLGMYFIPENVEKWF